MSTTQPIRKTEDIEALKHYFLYEKPSLRNYALLCLGINSALRIGDLLSLTWADIYDFTHNRFLKHIPIIEQKTKKPSRAALNPGAIRALALYKNSLANVKGTDALFPGQGRKNPLSRSQAFRILNAAGQALHLETAIGCHTLRKTFGYHAWKMGIQPALLMDIFNHSSFQVTRQYLGIDQDDIDQVFFQVIL